MDCQSPTICPVRPVVAIMSDCIDLHGHTAHAALHGYVRAVSEVAHALPVLLPAAPDCVDVESLLAGIDGLVLTGSPSNVAADHYAAPPLAPAVKLDRDRDAVVLPMIRRLISAGLPVLGICRGLQELNVAFGGTLHPAVHEQPNRLDHREGDHDRPVRRWYDDSHDVHIAAGGRLAELLGDDRVPVNSLHHQGIERLGRGLRVEATAPDGLIEAFSIEDARQWTLALQWHPEMRIDDSALSRAIFASFGAACRARRTERQRQTTQGI
ncbi:gamma-glutamyl-gamma-aminobutyrate hydrolase family protein [Bradyrhizobium sp. UFLA05-109]